jgi:hypothetical protein
MNIKYKHSIVELPSHGHESDTLPAIRKKEKKKKNLY